MGMGLPFRAMETFWNQMEVVGAQHRECTACHGNACFNVVNMVAFALGASHHNQNEGDGLSRAPGEPCLVTAASSPGSLFCLLAGLRTGWTLVKVRRKAPRGKRLRKAGCGSSRGPFRRQGRGGEAAAGWPPSDAQNPRHRGGTSEVTPECLAPD